MAVRTSGRLVLCYFVRLMLQLELWQMLNCVNWVSCFSYSIHSRSVYYLWFL